MAQGLSLAAVAEQAQAPRHLVRTWLTEDNIPFRGPGGSTRGRRPSRPLKPIPPGPELRRLQEVERVSIAELARRYRVHPQTAAGWLRHYQLPAHLPPPRRVQ